MKGVFIMPKYNHRFEEDEDGNLFELWTDKSGSETHIVEISSDDDDDSEEDCCAACGNPAYPDCMSSCSLFDD